MSRNTATLQCPECKHKFTQDCLHWTPVCPKCGYQRSGQEGKPKFQVVNK